jgi:hypothetical protein
MSTFDRLLEGVGLALCALAIYGWAILLQALLEVPLP